MLFIGNVLTDYGQNPSQLEVLYVRLKRYAEITIYSDKLNKYYRLIDMLFGILQKNSRNTTVFIDTYSHYAFYYALFCSLICQLLNTKYIPILRGGNLPFRLRRNPYLSKIIFSSSLVNISPSIFLKKEFEEYGFKSRYIPNIIRINKYPFQLRMHCKPKLLWVRALHKSYNPKMAIKVLSELIKIYPYSSLCMVGPDKDGSYTECIQLAKILGVEKNIHFTGFLKKSTWINLSKDCDIFINTTNYDNMPVSVIEAMSLGLPVVSTNAGGLQYFHQDGQDALMVPRNAAGAMVEKIKLLINDSILFFNLSLNARRKAEGFCWEKVKLDWLRLLSLE